MGQKVSVPLPKCLVSTAGIQFGEMERRRTSSLPPSQVPCCDDCLSRCLCYAKFCGPICGPPMFDVCMSPVDLRLRQLKGQEKKWGPGAVHASRGNGGNSSSNTNEMQQSRHGSDYNGEEADENNDIVYMPSIIVKEKQNERRWNGDGGHQHPLSVIAGDAFTDNNNHYAHSFPGEEEDCDSRSECDENSPRCSDNNNNNSSSSSSINGNDSDIESNEGAIDRNVYYEGRDGDVDSMIHSLHGSNSLDHHGSFDDFHSFIDLERVHDDGDDDSSVISSTMVSTATPSVVSSSISDDEDENDDISEASSTLSSSSIGNYVNSEHAHTLQIPDINRQPREHSNSPRRHMHRRFPSAGSVNAFSRLDD